MKYVIDPDDLEGWKIHEGVTAKMVGEGQKMTSLMTIWEPGARFSMHSHSHEQIGVCLQGEAIFIIDGDEYVVKKGDVYNIPSNVPHNERNDGDEPAVFVECFAPVREDLLRRRFEQKIHEK
ncbi:MAG: cupin domain-containing protein [Desulfobacteraceae bacterium]|nr:cupin domain-containing protein [Desulfobacteraceae bacterium]